ncbi:MAG: 23S rRNA pseudouridine1911/1915/1917 synthase [Arenicella sp.]|jgi:23S rRNA pseudouridine1911/1915/1917 synthase
MPQNSIEILQIPKLQTRERLLEWVIGKLGTVSTRNGVKKAIKKGLLFVNEEQANSATFIYGGETVSLLSDKPAQSKPEIDLKLEVLYEDDELAIVSKPAGILVSGNKKWTLENALSSNLKQSTQADFLPNPEPIHRLDYPTSGALLIGKTAKSVIQLNQLFEQRKIQKTYFAVAIGEMPNSGMIESRVWEKEAKTHFQLMNSVVSERFTKLNLIKLQPETGRKHQLRIHLSEMGNPILGDLKYGTEGLVLKGKGLYLHAYSLEFASPTTGKMVFVEASLPKKFGKLFEIKSSK